MTGGKTGSGDGCGVAAAARGWTTALSVELSGIVAEARDLLAALREAAPSSPRRVAVSILFMASLTRCSTLLVACSAVLLSAFAGEADCLLFLVSFCLRCGASCDEAVSVVSSSTESRLLLRRPPARSSLLDRITR
jgi:hypothetical protein